MPPHLDRFLRKMGPEDLNRLLVWPDSVLHTNIAGTKSYKYTLDTTGKEVAVKKYVSPKAYTTATIDMPDGTQRFNKKKHCLVAKVPGLPKEVLIEHVTRKNECNIWWGPPKGWMKGGEILREELDEEIEPEPDVREQNSVGKRRRAEEEDDDDFDDVVPAGRRKQANAQRTIRQPPLKLRLRAVQHRTESPMFYPDLIPGNHRQGDEVLAAQLDLTADEETIVAGGSATPGVQPGMVRAYPTPATATPLPSGFETPTTGVSNKDVTNANIMVHFVDAAGLVVRPVALAKCDSIGRFFNNAMAAFKRFGDDDWMLLVSHEDDEPQPLVRGYQQDFERVMEHLRAKINVKMEGGEESLADRRSGEIVIKAWILG